jgi:HEAT repeat protein
LDNGPDAIARLLEQLKDTDSVIRENSAYIIGELALQARSLSSNTLKSSEQLKKINSLTDQRHLDEVTSILIKTLQDTDAWVRGNAADALGKTGSLDALAPLAELINDDDKIVRYSATSAIGEINVSEGIGTLICALDDSEWSVRLAAAKALERIPDVRAVDALRKTAKDKNPDVRDISKAALVKLSA